ncbi:thiol-activated cytolysin family protein [Mariniflexile gromovii]|uniref:Thiol-activated cytolysin family protein n=1 Tax=Mariniflexile gromovii TaxID=362523 RepID=A0ABS4BXN4_9FLAO|nr:thiol-activated cytolysin family protein [Mariniflexile gromovii]MBP0905355.1 thiol-activated cytolysin family protein [Mariniflexile gromovii]
MKTQLLTIRNIMNSFMFAIFLIFLSGCSKEELVDSGQRENPDAQNISDLIKNLSYNANTLLNVKETGGGPNKRTKTSDKNTSTSPNLGYYETCNTKKYSLETNFDDVAILRPTNGIIWPGALVVGNQGMLDGMPDPITLGRAPVKLRIDLPGIGEKGNIVVENPTNSVVQSSIDDALEWWNANKYQEGYINASNSSYQSTKSYSSKQVSLDVGLNLEWATGAVASQMEYQSSTTKRAATMVYKQVFYTVTMDTPSTPASVFGADVSLAKVENAINDKNPPAYINSVSYGRIIMFKLETTDTNTSVDLDAVLEYAGGVNGTGTVNATYDAVLKKSSITVVTIGGNAEVASEAVSATGPGSLRSIITGKNAVYSRDNPGVPIAYTIRYLKDNTFAKMGYTTDYEVVDCSIQEYQHKNVYLDNSLLVDSRFRFAYKKKGTQTLGYTDWKKVSTNASKEGIKPPSGAHGVTVQFQAWDFTWKSLGEYYLNYVSSEKNYETYCSKWVVVCTQYSVRAK